MLKNKRALMTVLLALVIFAAGNVYAEGAKEALALLKEGNARFVRMKMRYPDVSAQRRTDTAVNGQKPFATVLACADSRVPVEGIFDRGIGDIFVVRVAGNIAEDPSVIGSMEYSAGHLNCPLLVIMGHTNCGAVKAAISGPPLEGGIRNIQKTIEAAVEKVKKEHPALQKDELTSAVVKENVREAMRDLLAKSEVIRRMVGEGKLKIVLAVYDIRTGAVEWI